MSHKPGGRLPLLSTRPAVTPATLKRAATYFAAQWTKARWVWTVCLRLLPTASRLRFEPGPFCVWVQRTNHSATTLPTTTPKFVSQPAKPPAKKFFMCAHSRTQINVWCLKTINIHAGQMRQVSFMWHFLNMRTTQSPNMLRKYGTELLETNYPISFHRGPDTRMVPFCWQSDGRGNKT